jgi:hypothetical protein
MITKRLAPLYVLLLLLCARSVAAQPTCFVNYDLSYPCVFPTADIIFVGRVVSVTDMNPDAAGKSQQVEVNRLYGTMRGKAVVAVDTLLKGKAAARVEISFYGVCWGYIEVGKQFVFNVRQTPTGLYVDNWSKELGIIPKDDETHYLEMMRAIIRGERQPRLFGRLRHYAAGYYFQVGQPIPNVTVVAENYTERFETRTNAEGRYEFRNLPDGEYRVFALLPESLRPPDTDSGEPRKRDERRVTIQNNIACGTPVDFVAWDNGAITVRVEDANGKPVKYRAVAAAAFYRRGLGKDADGKLLKWVEVSLRIDEKMYESIESQSRIRQVSGPKDGEFGFVNLPPGRYRLEFYAGNADNTSEGVDGKFVFLRYPSDVPGAKNPQMINLAAGQQLREIVIRLPIPDKN